jgi:hypothetical protein
VLQRKVNQKQRLGGRHSGPAAVLYQSEMNKGRNVVIKCMDYEGKRDLALQQESQVSGTQ